MRLVMTWTPDHHMAGPHHIHTTCTARTPWVLVITASPLGIMHSTSIGHCPCMARTCLAAIHAQLAEPLS